VLKQIFKFMREEKGATFLEYAVMASFIAVVAAFAIASLGTTISPIFSTAAATFGS
jgi:Flp pilus assembly pilin Flp